MTNDLLRRIRWANVARAAAIGLALALVIAWPRLRGEEAPLPPAAAVPAERKAVPEGDVAREEGAGRPAGEIAVGHVGEAVKEKAKRPVAKKPRRPKKKRRPRLMAKAAMPATAAQPVARAPVRRAQPASASAEFRP